MFAGKSFLYLFSELFLNYYKSFGVLSLQDEETWMSFFPKSQQIITLKEGSELYTSEEKYRKYKDAFDKYINSSTLYFKSVLEKNNIESSDIKKFFELVTEHFSHYSKTEFFYTDSIDQNKMIISIEDFDKLKLSGRSYLNQMFFEEAGFIKSFTSKIGEQVGVDKSDLLNYGISELIDLVTKGIKLSSQQIKDRALFFHSKDLTLFGSESKILTNQFLSIYREISNIIKGSIANKGKATGKARVLVPDWKDFDKIAIAVKEMEEGEILVAETTSPDIITACKKASAIITNQGGMLSHAAIVSRELGIPCIIGTDKDVILNIKTGDKLEVDADNGIIKILNKN
jgi:phosphohistidine swiveling domain-containing protein